MSKPETMTIEAVAWTYELATTLNQQTGERGGWKRYLSWGKPYVPQDAIRDLVALGPLTLAPSPSPAVSEAEKRITSVENALRASKGLIDNINEFGQVTDGEILDCAERAVRAALSALENGKAGLADAHSKSPPVSEAPEGRVAVKALEWVEVLPDQFQAKALGLRYVVVDRQWWEDGGRTYHAESNDEAKAGAQADFDARIRSALTTPPAPSTDALAMAVEEWESIEQVIEDVARELGCEAKPTVVFREALKLAKRARTANPERTSHD